MTRTCRIELALFCAVGAAAALPFVGSAGCGGELDIHATEEVRGKACVSCHESAYKAAKNPLHVGVMPLTCNDCHGTHGWRPVSFGREGHKWFPLQNKHDGPACASCHTKGFNPGATSKECRACHEKDYAAAKSPVHEGFPTDCKLCHGDAGWKPSIFQHPWPLQGKHATIACTSCHKDGEARWAGVSTDCASCHQKNYDEAKSPIHQPLPPTGGMLVSGGRTCADCHLSGGGTSTGGWRPTLFVHPTAPFALTGAHADPARVTCNDCHQAPKPAGTAPRGYDARTFSATKCVDCHLDGPKSYTTAKPAHTGFPKDCVQCHATDTFLGAKTHPEAKFRLTAPSAHVGLECADCHDVARGPSKAGANTNCTACHGFASGTWSAVHSLPPLNQRHGFEVCAAGESPSSSETCFPNPTQSATTPNVCLACHPGGAR